MELNFIDTADSKIKKARDERNPNARFEMFINSEKALSLQTSQFPGFREQCGRDKYIFGFGTQETLDALEKYAGTDVESVDVFDVLFVNT